MPKRSALFIAAILSLLAILLILGLKRMGSAVSTKADRETGNGNASHPSLIGNSDQSRQTKRDRQDDAEALRELEAEFDEILPAIYDGFSSLCDTTLSLGETLVLGGFRHADGNYEFTMLELKPTGADGAPMQEGSADRYNVTATVFKLSREKSVEMGLGSLISPAITRIQKSVAFPPGEAPSIHAEAVAVKESFEIRPDQTAKTGTGTDSKAYRFSMIVSPEDTGKSIRIRTRVESPAEDGPDVGE
jgi:hypothetical protein